MATGKTAILLFSDLSADALLNSEAAELVKIRRKGSMVPLQTAGDIKAEALAGAAAGESMLDAAKAGGYVTEELSAACELFVAEPKGEEALLEVLRKAFEVSANKSVIVIAVPGLALFYGLGIERAATLSKPLPAGCIAPTLAWIADLPLPAQVEAAPAWGVLKGLNFKAAEMAKLKKSMDALMLNIERNNRKPWDKHDCA